MVKQQPNSISDKALLLGLIFLDIVVLGFAIPNITKAHDKYSSPKSPLPAILPSEQPVQVNPSAVIGEPQVAKSTPDTTNKN